MFSIPFWRSITPDQTLVAAGLFLVLLILSCGAIAIVIVKIPANYFRSRYKSSFLSNGPWLVRWAALVLKNLMGILLIAVGIFLSLPGIPGQGILTILLGLIMVDIPGKRPLEIWMIKRPMVLSALNNIRARCDKPPLEVD